MSRWVEVKTKKERKKEIKKKKKKKKRVLMQLPKLELEYC
jgi:hypothetical protein